MGGGGGAQIGSPYGEGGGNRGWDPEQPSIRKGYHFQQDQLNRYVNQSPLLSSAEKGSLGFWDQLPGMLSQFGGFRNELEGNQSTLGGLFGQSQDLYGKFGEQADTLGGWLGQVSPTIESGGALTSQGERDVSQASRLAESQYGTAHSIGGLGRELLNRDAYKQQRFDTALRQGQGLLGQQQGVYGAQQGTLGLGAALTGQQSALTGQKAGLLGQEQGLQTGGLNQLLGVEGAEVSNFSALTNPILAYLGNMFSGNQQTQIAQAQLSQQASQASDAKTMQSINSALSAVGTIAGGVAMSDERLKTKVEDTGVKVDDIPLKIYEFKTRPGVKLLGPMAQDVEKLRPDAVATDKTSGLKVIDFARIRAPMVELHPYGEAA